MHKPIFSPTAGLLTIALLLSCATTPTPQFDPPEDWPTIQRSESDFKRLFDNNLKDLDAIEGIWTMHETGTWRNVRSGVSGSLPGHNPYRLAIVRDTTFPNYDFVVVVLESEYSFWPPGRIKAYFRKTVYQNIYEGLWYLSWYEPNRENWTLEDGGLLTSTRTIHNPKNMYEEATVQSTLTKGYPPLSDEARLPDESKLRTVGSGFLLSTTGLVVTNSHVVQEDSQVEVVFPEERVVKKAAVRIRDSRNDIAILGLDDFSPSDVSIQEIPFVLADVGSIRIGQEVFTLGFPLGDIMGTKSRLSTGRINSLFGIQDDPRLLQISNPLQPGNSGGPLFNSKGELVGIVVSGLNAKYFYENVGIIPQNVNFAIKASYLKNLLSMIPEGDEILTRRNLVTQTSMEKQIVQLNLLVVQVRTH